MFLETSAPTVLEPPEEEDEIVSDGSTPQHDLYARDILLASSDMSLLLETKKFLSSNFDVKDMGEASYVLG